MTKETTFEHPPRGHVAITGYDASIDKWRAANVNADGELEIKIEAAEQLEALAHQYTGSAWVKANLLWGYHDRLVESTSATSDGSSPTDVNGTAVPEGEVWYVLSIALYHDDPTSRDLMARLNCGGTGVTLARWNSVAQWYPETIQSPLVLKEDDFVVGRCYSLASTKKVYLEYCGYKMGIAM